MMHTKTVKWCHALTGDFLYVDKSLSTVYLFADLWLLLILLQCI